jgi:DNA-3-methyladenine glycosylase II
MPPHATEPRLAGSGPVHGFAVPVEGPLHAGRTLDRYALFGEDPACRLVDGTLYRAARLEDDLVPFRIAVAGSVVRSQVTVSFVGADTPAVRRRLTEETRSLLGLDGDLRGFARVAARDPALAPLVRPGSPLFGLRASVTPDPLEMLVGAISAQQVNLAFAFATRARLVRALGTAATLGGVPVWAFPTAAQLASAEPAALRAMQFSTRKAEAIVGLGRAVTEGSLDLAGLRARPDEAVIEALVRVKGLGRWSAEWFLARALGRPDACPADDLGVRRAAEALCFRGQAADAERVRRRAERWRPYRSLAVHYLLAGHRQARALARAGAAPRVAGASR